MPIPRSGDCVNYETDIRSSLDALNLFGVRQPRTLLLALLRAYRDGVIKAARLRKALRAIESYHFITTAVVGVSSTGGISVMYASHARQISTATSAAQVHTSIDVLVNKLHKVLSNRDTFLSEFGDALFYSQERPEKRRLVQYALRMFMITLGRDSRSTILSAILSTLRLSRTRLVGLPTLATSFGSTRSDQKFGSLSFELKRPILEAHSQTYDFSDIVAEDEWGQEQVDARRKKLAGLAYDKIWRVLG